MPVPTLPAAFSDPGMTTVRLLHPRFEARPPKSAAWSPSAFEAWRMTLVHALEAVVMETVRSRKSPTKIAGEVRVEPETN
jgi:hypothetical protein